MDRLTAIHTALASYQDDGCRLVQVKAKSSWKRTQLEVGPQHLSGTKVQHLALSCSPGGVGKVTWQQLQPAPE